MANVIFILLQYPGMLGCVFNLFIFSVVDPYHFDMDPDPDRGKADPTLDLDQKKIPFLILLSKI